MPENENKSKAGEDRDRSTEEKMLQGMKEVGEAYMNGGSNAANKEINKKANEVLDDTDLLSGLEDLKEKLDVSKVVESVGSPGHGGCEKPENQDCSIGGGKIKQEITEKSDQGGSNPMTKQDSASRNQQEQILDNAQDMAKKAREKGLIPKEASVENVKEEGKSVIEQTVESAPEDMKDMAKDAGLTDEDGNVDGDTLDKVVEGGKAVAEFFGII